MIGFRPDQLPLSTVTVRPSCGVPEGSGCFVFAGSVAEQQRSQRSERTAPGSCRRRSWPSLRPGSSCRRRRTRRRSSDSSHCRSTRSCSPRSYSAATDRCRLIGVVPPHEPFEAVKVCPSRAVPAMVGSELLTGGLAAVRTAAATAEAGQERESAGDDDQQQRNTSHRVPPSWMDRSKPSGQFVPAPASMHDPTYTNYSFVYVISCKRLRVVIFVYYVSRYQCRQLRQREPTPRAVPDFAFLTNHGKTLLLIAHDRRIRMRDIAGLLHITERATQRIVADLARAGYIERERDGRRNLYSVQNRHTARAADPARHRHRIPARHPGRGGRSQRRDTCVITSTTAAARR